MLTNNPYGYIVHFVVDDVDVTVTLYYKQCLRISFRILLYFITASFRQNRNSSSAELTQAQQVI